MRTTGAAQLQGAGTTPGSQRWRNLLWKALLAGALLVLLFVGVPAPGPLLVQSTVLLWGALFVWLAGGSLFHDIPSLKWAWCALAVGGYAVLSIAMIITGDPRQIADPAKMVEALGPVVALTMVAHLGRHDLQRALRDWAVVVGLALYAALGVGAMWVVLATFGLAVFSLAVLLPPLVLEMALLMLRRFTRLGAPWRYVLALLPSTSLAVGIISSTQLNPTMNLTSSIMFDVIIGVLIGGALLVSLLTRPMTEAASVGFGGGGMSVSRALIEFTHGAMLIGLAMYIPLRLFT